MWWVLCGIVYVATVGSLVKFFQFVSDADRSIQHLWSEREQPRKFKKIPRRVVRQGRDSHRKIPTVMPSVEIVTEPIQSRIV